MTEIKNSCLDCKFAGAEESDKYPKLSCQWANKVISPDWFRGDKQAFDYSSSPQIVRIEGNRPWINCPAWEAKEK
jgi:hypothetical protein